MPSVARMKTGLVAVGAMWGVACGAVNRQTAEEDPYGVPAVRPSTATATAPTPPAPKKPDDPAHLRAEQLREGANLLEKAADAHGLGQKSYAEQLFSTAEILVGAGAIADIAPIFREGAPPRIDTPLKAVPKDAAPQPIVVGSSEEEHPEPPRPKKGTLTGKLSIDGFGVVTLTPNGKSLRAIPTARVMEQRGRQFAPHVLVVPLGSLVLFPNFDPIFHNVFSVSEAKPFDLGLYKTGQAREVLFDKEGAVRLGCNLHANMSAFIVVVAAPYYTTANANGGFSFRSLEPGRYTLRAYAESSTAPISQELEIKPGTNQITVGVVADAPSGPLPDKFGVARAGKKP